ncbi:hypothetical protein Goarm_017375, partial [Gossypium armourianum]|nr:hypothetical protein [Gossypium armourianum]
EESQAATVLSLFPQLKSLELKDLPHLSGFCSNSQNKVIEFPFLKSMTIYNCPILEGFICRYTSEGNQRISSHGDLFDNKVAFPSLEEMSVSYLSKMKMLWRNPLPANSFPKLQELRVERCDKLLTIFPSNMVTTFQRLHRLTIKTCGSLQQVFEIMHEEKKPALPPTTQLKKLHIVGLPKLKYIWKNDPRVIFSFKNICSISVFDCPSLKNVFPASIAQDLPQLGYLDIFHCGVEEIVSKLEEGSDWEATVNFKFDRLCTLTLSNLPKLKCFYPGKHIAKWPMLNMLEVVECGKMKIF